MDDDPQFTVVPPDATPAEEHDLRYPVVPPPATHDMAIPTKRPQDTLKSAVAQCS